MSTRRDFLRKTLAGAAVAATGATAAAATVPTIASDGARNEFVNRSAFKPLPVSCLSYSFHGLVGEGMMDIFHYFETCRFRYGIDAADLWNGMIKDANDDAYINKIHRALQERQLVVPSIAADGAHLISSRNRDSPENRAQLRANQDRYMDIAKKLGAGFLRFDAGPLAGGGLTNNTREMWSPEDFDYLVKRYRELAQKAYDWGFIVGNENHVTHSKYWPNMEKLIQAVDHPGFGICVHYGDVGGWTPHSPETMRQDNEAFNRASAKWTAHTHFEWDYTEDADLLHRMMSILRDAGYKGYYSAECYAGRNELLLTGIMMDRIKAILNNWNNGGTGELYPRRR